MHFTMLWSMYHHAYGSKIDVAIILCQHINQKLYLYITLMIKSLNMYVHPCSLMLCISMIQTIIQIKVCDWSKQCTWRMSWFWTSFRKGLLWHGWPKIEVCSSSTYFFAQLRLVWPLRCLRIKHTKYMF